MRGLQILTFSRWRMIRTCGMHEGRAQMSFSPHMNFPNLSHLCERKLVQAYLKCKSIQTEQPCFLIFEHPFGALPYTMFRLNARHPFVCLKVYIP